MKKGLLFLWILAPAVLVGLLAGLVIRAALTEGEPPPSKRAAEATPAAVSRRIGFTAADVSGEISAEISPFKSGISGTYVEVHMTNVSGDRQVILEYIKVAFFDARGRFLDYGEGKVGKTLRPGETISSFLYLSKGKPPAFYHEHAKQADFDRIGGSEPYQRSLQPL